MRVISRNERPASICADAVPARETPVTRTLIWAGVLPVAMMALADGVLPSNDGWVL